MMMKSKLRVLAVAVTMVLALAFAEMGQTTMGPSPVGLRDAETESTTYSRAGGVGNLKRSLQELGSAQRQSEEGGSDIPCPGQGECGP